jgi:hypothetical protein
MNTLLQLRYKSIVLLKYFHCLWNITEFFTYFPQERKRRYPSYYQFTIVEGPIISIVIVSPYKN